MVRTQIYIKEETHRTLLRLAKSQAKPMAELVRDFIEHGIVGASNDTASGTSTLKRLVNSAVQGGPRDLSENIDHYLYDSPRRKIKR